jgi:hypothetical protein
MFLKARRNVQSHVRAPPLALQRAQRGEQATALMPFTDKAGLTLA